MLRLPKKEVSKFAEGVPPLLGGSKMLVDLATLDTLFKCCHLREGHSIRPHKTKSPRLRTHVATIHVPVDFLFVVRCLTVDISHEWAACGCLVGNTRHDHAERHILDHRSVLKLTLRIAWSHVTYTAGDTMDGVINESIRRVHFTPRLAVRTLEGVLSLKGCAASRVANVSMDSSREQVRPQSGKPAKLPGVDLSSNVGSHVDCRITIFRHIVLRYRVAT